MNLLTSSPLGKLSGVRPADRRVRLAGTDDLNRGSTFLTAVGSLALVSLVGVVDYLTGLDVSVLLLYLILTFNFIR